MRFLQILKWQLTLLAKYQIITVALVIAVLYTLIFKLIPGAQLTEVLVLLLFTDPTMMGFLFIGAIVLFEKADGSLSALITTPMSIGIYLWSKALALTLVALAASFVMAFICRGLNFNYLLLFLAVASNGILFTFIGFIGVSKVKTINQFILVIPLFLMPTSLPLLSYFGLSKDLYFMPIPTHASLNLFHSAFEQTGILKIALSLSYLLVWIWIGYKLAYRAFEKNIIH